MPDVYKRTRHWVDTVDPTTGTTIYGKTRITAGDTWYNSSSSSTFICTSASAGTWTAMGGGGGGGSAAVWLSGSGPPSAGTGNDGDMYLDTDTNDVYGPKSGGAWGAAATNITGATGATGAAGADGADGAAGAWASVGTGSGTGASTVDISLSSSADVYRLVIHNLCPNTGGSHLHSRVSTSSTYVTGTAYNWADPRPSSDGMYYNSGGGGGGGSGAAATFARLATNNSANANLKHMVGYIDIFNPHDTGKYTTWLASLRRAYFSTPNFYIARHISIGTYHVANDVDGFRLYFSSGNVDYDYTLLAL